MKSLPLVLVLLTATAAVAQELDFTSVTITKELRGERKGRVVTVTLEGRGRASVRVHEVSGEVRTMTGPATRSELTAVRRAYRAADVAALPQHILAFDASAVDEDAEEGSLRLQSILPDGRATSTTADLGQYDDYAARIEPVVTALEQLERRFVCELHGGFRSIELDTRAAGGPTPGATSAFGVRAPGEARLDRRLPGAPPSTVDGVATTAELERVVAALGAVDLARIPDGHIVDPRAAESVAEVRLVIVLADGTVRSISARRGLYGKHRLAPLVDALEAIASRMAKTGGTNGRTGLALDPTDAIRGLSGALGGGPTDR